MKLSDQVEAATGADRGLDTAITMEVMAGLGADMRGKMTHAEYLAKFPGLCSEYTASLDAGLTLTPRDCHPSVILRQAIDACIISAAMNEDGEPFIERLAIFVAAAALRARGL